MFGTSRRVLLSMLLMVFPYLPASNIIFPVGFVVAERVLYIPSLGFCLLVALGFEELRVKTRPKTWRSLFLLNLLGCFTWRTLARNQDWSSRETLFLSGLRSIPQNAKMHYNYANLQKDLGEMDRALLHYQEAIRLWPSYASAHNNLATLLENETQAEFHYILALKYHPDHPNALINLSRLKRCTRASFVPYRKQGDLVTALELMKRISPEDKAKDSEEDLLQRNHSQSGIRNSEEIYVHVDEVPSGNREMNVTLKDPAYLDPFQDALRTALSFFNQRDFSQACLHYQLAMQYLSIEDNVISDEVNFLDGFLLPCQGHT
ncbi:unnamed protein product [Darwinula stevensoni]|uniref:Uncharacterized protein n=1 Tax=Darwinula stevensoni TaxID=69355 RepID=A0A7R8XAP1_9CRUS|nr:unnamed protein product [Darwinula stevensoni]CAG0883981.1 unnamed protein product [Darwinula stevensoni]